MEKVAEPKNKKTEEFTMGVVKANLIGLLLVIPILAVILSPFLLIWDYETLTAGMKDLDVYLVYIFVGGIIIHELLHGLTWGYFAPNGLKSIKFGVEWKFLTPYCHCKEPLKVKHYKIGAAMPLIIMGIIPSIIGLIIGHGGVLVLGILFTGVAAGDMIALYMIRNLDNDIYVSDHPDKMGIIREIEPETNIAWT